MARLAAFGDAHLGKSYLAHLRDEAGRNIREEDFLRSFAWAVDRTIELEPDGFLLLGDIFDLARPSYRNFTQVLIGLKKLEESGLTGVAISGNHDTPRLRGTGSPYAALEESFGNVSFAWNLQGRSVDLAGVRVHAVPQTLNVEDFRLELDTAAGRLGTAMTNLLIAHVALTSLPAREWRDRDINELEVEEGAFDKRFDLVLLGHYHVHQKVSTRTWYAGSTDSFTFADRPAGAGPKGMVLLDTDEQAVEFFENPEERPLVTCSVNAAGLSPRELVEACERAGRDAPEGCIARIFLNEADPAAYRQVPREELQDAVPRALHVQVETDFAAPALAVQGGAEIGTLESEWERFLEVQDLAGLERPRVEKIGARFLADARGEET